MTFQKRTFTIPAEQSKPVPPVPQKKIAPPTPSKCAPPLPTKNAPPVPLKKVVPPPGHPTISEEEHVPPIPEHKHEAPPIPEHLSVNASQRNKEITQNKSKEKKELAKDIAGDVKDVYNKMPSMTEEQKQHAKEEASKAGKTAYSGAKKAVKSEEFKQAKSQVASGAKAAVHSKQFKAFTSGLAKGTKSAVKGDASAKDVWKESTKDIPDLDEDQKKDLKQRGKEASKTAKTSYEKASQTEEWKQAKEQTKTISKEVYESEQFQVAKKEGEKKTAQRMTGREDAEFDPSITMQTSVKPTIVTDENGKKKLGVGITVKPKFAMDGDEINTNAPAMTVNSTVDPKLKKNEDGTTGIDWGMKPQKPVVSNEVPKGDGPEFSFDTKVKPKVEYDEFGQPKMKMDTQTGNYGASCKGHSINEQQIKEITK
ncbi:hypothetical protein ENUP19_0080G0080 [Entamoeba nuttalli]|uniref:Uncharacterized protein n=2 Tax=Entamoeba nuttalli TaxID=412467 RepID=K2H6C9_ENTNP|nr:hypothetical protein ENU1_034850 [Entamoeba nuttalli P19]EKE42042.1 hypothetical protein ENU1_034850 [Entamoeba nuttalli P19]|eukprot:XP_008855622.1 hypothetical protein ENU1_034850 [Entamoeba nuttalli P19]